MTTRMYAPWGKSGTVMVTGRNYTISADGSILADDRDRTELQQAGFAVAGNANSLTYRLPTETDLPGRALDTRAAETAFLDDLDPGGGQSKWNRALTWLNKGHYRTLYLPKGIVTLDTTPLDPIVGFGKAVIGQGAGTLLVKPTAAAADGLVFRIGNGSNNSCIGFTLKELGLLIQNWAAANEYPLVVDGANNVVIDLYRGQDLPCLLRDSRTADVFNSGIDIAVMGGSSHLETNRHFIHLQRTIGFHCRKMSCPSTLGGTAYTFFIDARDHSTDASMKVDTVEIEHWNVWSPAGVPSIFVLDATLGQIGNVALRAWGADASTDAAILIKADSGSSIVNKVELKGRATPKSGQYLRMVNGGTGFWGEIRATDFTADAKDEAIIEMSGPILDTVLRGTIIYTGTGTPTLESLVKIGSSHVTLDLTVSRGYTGGGLSPYNYVVETTADVDDLDLEINDLVGADIALVKHFAYSGGGKNITLNGDVDWPETVKAGDYTLTAQDSHKLVRFTAVATATLPAAADCRGDWQAIIKAGGGDVTVTRAGSDTVDGGATVTVANGSGAWIKRTGSGTFVRMI